MTELRRGRRPRGTDWSGAWPAGNQVERLGELETDPTAVYWIPDEVLDRPVDVVLWRRLAVAGWITAAGRRGFYAEDVTYDVLDWRRDSDDDYAGTVRLLGETFDLVANDGIVRICHDYRYDA